MGLLKVITIMITKGRSRKNKEVKKKQQEQRVDSTWKPLTFMCQRKNKMLWISASHDHVSRRPSLWRPQQLKQKTVLQLYIWPAAERCRKHIWHDEILQINYLQYICKLLSTCIPTCGLCMASSSPSSSSPSKNRQGGVGWGAEQRLAVSRYIIHVGTQVHLQRRVAANDSCFKFQAGD